MKEETMEFQATLTDPAMMLTRLPVEAWELRHSGREDESFTVRGYTGVYEVLSHDMGGFRTEIAGDALDEVLATKPDVHFVWDHDTRYVGARTTNGTLSLSSDTTGLFMDARVGQYTWAKDLKTALERGDIDQGSMKILIGADEWRVDGPDDPESEEEGELIRRVTKADGLYDVTVTAQGAFPQTNVAVAYSLVESARSEGRLPLPAGAALVAPETEGEPESHKGSDDQSNRWAEARRNMLRVTRDQIDDLLERSGRL